MSAEEIIAELPKLKPEEFRLVKAKVDVWRGHSGGRSASVARSGWNGGRVAEAE